MSADNEILDVIAEAAWDSEAGNASLGGCKPLAIDILAALRDAGYEVVPTDIAKLGRSVAEFQAPDYYLAIIDIYEQAGVERPPGTP